MTERKSKNIDDLEKHLTKTKTNSNRKEEEDTYKKLGKDNFSLSDFQKAINYHNQSLGIAKEVGDRVGEGRAYMAISAMFITSSANSKKH